jgi:hypothetical protein
MHYLVHGVVATGDDAFHPGQSPPPPELPEPDHDGSDSEKGSVGDVAVISKVYSCSIYNIYLLSNYQFI